MYIAKGQLKIIQVVTDDRFSFCGAEVNKLM
jgi:hypothetical protein